MTKQEQPPSDLIPTLHGRIFVCLSSLLVFILWAILGIYNGYVVNVWKQFDVTFDWPRSILYTIHWVWTTPVGILLAFLMIKTRCSFSGRKLVLLHAGVWAVTLALWFICWWGAIPHVI